MNGLGSESVARTAATLKRAKEEELLLVLEQKATLEARLRELAGDVAGYGAPSKAGATKRPPAGLVPALYTVRVSTSSSGWSGTALALAYVVFLLGDHELRLAGLFRFAYACFLEGLQCLSQERCRQARQQNVKKWKNGRGEWRVFGTNVLRS
jgi:hypothetical protein